VVGAVRRPGAERLVEAALRDNRDLRVAAARVDQFIGALTATGSQFYPQIGYGADASRARASAVGQPPLPPAPTRTSRCTTSAWAPSGRSTCSAAFAARPRRAGAGLCQRAGPARRRAHAVSSVAAATSCCARSTAARDRPGHGAQLQTPRCASSSCASRRHRRQDRGDAGPLAGAAGGSRDPAFQQAIAAQENLISILLGRNPGDSARRTIDSCWHRRSRRPAAALLLRRPDILQAEQNLVAANASIGAARAQYYRTCRAGRAGHHATAFSSLFSGPAAAGLIGAG